MKNIKSIKTVSEYIALGGMAVGMLLESPVKESEKALAFKAVKFNACGNPYDALAWLPKSQLVEVENDFYTNEAPAKMHILPNLALRKKLCLKNPLQSAASGQLSR